MEGFMSSSFTKQDVPIAESTRNFQKLTEEISNLKQEVLARKQAEEALHRSQRELSDFFENASIGLHWVGLDGIIIKVNQTELDLLGYSREEYVGHHIAEFHVDQPVITDILSRLSHGEILREYSARLRCKDGSVRDVLINSNVLFEDGQFIHTRCFTRDVTERKHAAETLKMAQERLSLAQQAARMGAFEWNIQTGVNTWTPELEAIYGLEPGEFGNTQLDWESFLHPADRDGALRGVEWSLQHTEPVEREFRIVRRDGTVRWLAGRWQMFKDCAGKPLRLSGVNFDITDRKQAEEALRASESRYRELIQVLPAAVYTCDACGRVTLYNHAAAVLWGREPVIGKDLWCGSWNIYRPDGTPLPVEECPMAVTLRTGLAVRGEEIIIERPDGTRRNVLPHPEPMRNAEGVLIGAVNMLVDITDRKLAEQDVARLAAIVTSSDDAIIGNDLRGTVTSWNRAAERLYGYTAEEMIGRPVTLLIPPDRQAEEGSILERIRRGDPVDHYETIRRCKDGSDVTISLTVSPVIDPQGRIIGASKIARNISEQKRIEAALRDRDLSLTAVNDSLKQHAAALAEANKELEGFSYSVSHDLRAPLRTIDAFSRILEEEHGLQLNPEAIRCLTIVRKAAAQAGELIDDLLELSKLGRQGMRFQPIQMSELVREVVDDLEKLHEGRTVDVIVADLPSCQGDDRLIKLVWINLVTNALKYTKYRDAARIEVGWLPDDASTGSVVYYVKDNGVGFDMKYAHKLFGVFQRLHRREEFEGTGVGLAIVQRIVHRHAGRVWAEGKVDDGATFYLSLRKGTA
jgi:PAS domain S-box-containing protein